MPGLGRGISHRAFRQGEDESRALRRRRLAPNFSAMKFDNALADRQAQPEALGIGLREALERLENLLALRFLDPRPVVGHPDQPADPLPLSR